MSMAQVQAQVEPKLANALKQAVLDAGGYGHNARIIREALEAHPEVRAQLEKAKREIKTERSR